MDDQAAYHPLVVLHDVLIVLNYSILVYGEHVSLSKQLWSSPLGLKHEGHRQYQHLREFSIPFQIDKQNDLVYVSLLARNIQVAPSSSTFPFLRNKTQASDLIQLYMVATPSAIAKKKKKGSTLCNVPLFSTMRYFTVITIYTIHKHYKKHNLGTWLGCIESRS